MSINNKEFTVKELTDMCKNIKIDLNGDDISDLIFYDNDRLLFQNKYYNAMTMVSSKEIKDVIREDKKFLIINKPMNEVKKKSPQRGFYTKYLEELDILVIVNTILKRVCFKWKWVEEERFFFTRDLRLNLDALCTVFSFDICGQTNYLDENLTEKAERWSLFNNLTDFRKKAIEFFGGFVWSYDMPHYYIRQKYDFCYKNYLKYVDLPYSSCAFPGSNTVVGLFEDGCEGIALDDVPQSFVNKIKDKARDRLLDYIEMCRGTRSRFVKVTEFEACYLQRVGDCYIQRCFRCIYDYKYPLCDTEASLVEYLRVKIDFNAMNKDYICVPIDGYDADAKGTCLEYVIGMVEKFNNWFGYSENSICRLFLMRVMLNLASYGPFEKLINLNIGKDVQCYQKDNIVKFVSSLFHGHMAADYMQFLFGEIDESQTELHKALGIPKGLLEYAYKHSDVGFGYIREIKKIFASAPCYFRRMNSTSYQHLYDSVEHIQQGAYVTLAIETLTILVELFGCENWTGYIEHIRKLQKNGLTITQHEGGELTTVKDFNEYIKKLVLIKDNIEGDFPMQWKVDGENLIKAEMGINDIYNIALDKTEYAKYAEKFLASSDKWKRYEYVGTDFLVTYPRKPSELANEGFWLNHCAKSYIEAAANNETMVLFIRRKEYPDKPFYTLEIRNNKIRQCHGHNNINIDAVLGLEGFLETYCKEKHVAFSTGDVCLQV